jgi:hypothetical protein
MRSKSLGTRLHPDDLTAVEPRSVGFVDDHWEVENGNSEPARAPPPSHFGQVRIQADRASSVKCLLFCTSVCSLGSPARLRRGASSPPEGIGHRGP